jgi:hypothetical protein
MDGSMTTTATPRRAIGIVRVSQVDRRDGESFASPLEQRDRIAAACRHDGLADSTRTMGHDGPTADHVAAAVRDMPALLECHASDD